MYRRCTKNGLLYGGPDYAVHGEEPCIHHTFCHAKALAEVLDFGITEPKDGDGVRLPSENPAPVQYFPAIDTYRLCAHGFLATVTGYDFEYLEGGHASGGAMTMLWHEKTGPIFASSMTDYSMKEVFNMQLTLKGESHEALTPTVELWREGVRYAQCYDYHSHIEVLEKAEEGNLAVRVLAQLAPVAQGSPVAGTGCQLAYELCENMVKLQVQLTGEYTGDARLILPVIGRWEKGCERQPEGLRVCGMRGAGAGKDRQSAYGA